MLRNAISLDIQTIKKVILNSPHDDNPGLFNGELGKSLFCLTDFKYTSDNASFDYAVSSLNSSISLFNSIENRTLLLSLTEGLPGLRYTLNEFKIFDTLEASELENGIDSLILNAVLETSKIYDLIGYDLLYGLTG